MEILLFCISLMVTLFFLNDKFSKAVRVIAFKEDETKRSAIVSLITMFAMVLLWVIFYYYVKVY